MDCTDVPTGESDCCGHKGKVVSARSIPGQRCCFIYVDQVFLHLSHFLIGARAETHRYRMLTLERRLDRAAFQSWRSRFLNALLFEWNEAALRLKFAFAGSSSDEDSRNFVGQEVTVVNGYLVQFAMHPPILTVRARNSAHKK